MDNGYSETELVPSPDLGVLHHPAVLQEFIFLKHLNHAGVPVGASELAVHHCMLYCYMEEFLSMGWRPPGARTRGSK